MSVNVITLAAECNTKLLKQTLKEGSVTPLLVLSILWVSSRGFTGIQMWHLQKAIKTRLDQEYANVSSYKRPQKHEVLNDWKLDRYIYKKIGKIKEQRWLGLTAKYMAGQSVTPLEVKKKRCLGTHRSDISTTAAVCRRDEFPSSYVCFTAWYQKWQ